MKNILLFILIFVTGTVMGQKDCPYYTKYINKGNLLLADQKFKDAINAFSIALLHCPDNAKEARDGIIKAFNEIETLKKIAEEREIEARENEKKAIGAKLLSDAYKLIFYAQEAVKNDPVLGLHLTKLSLGLLDSSKSGGKDSIDIADRAQRIYYENNFYETLIDPAKSTDIKGKFTKSIYAPDGKSIWTITDSAFAIQWNLNGQRLKTIPLDPSKQFYNFLQAEKGRIIIHGYTWYETKARGKVWDITKSNNPIEIPDFSRESSISYFAGRDSSNGWAQRLIVLGNKAFSLDEKGNLLPSVNGNSGSTTNIAISPDGQKIAYNTGQKTIAIMDNNRKSIGKITNTGNKVEELVFSPDGNLLLVETDANIKLFIPSKKMDVQNSDTPEYNVLEPSISLFGYKIHTHQFSPDGKRLLVSFGNPTSQVAQIYKINQKSNLPIELFAEYKCPGSPSNSASFSTIPQDASILTSSDKIRTWKIPKDKTEPAPNMFREKMEPEFYVAIDFIFAPDTLFYGYTASGKIIRYKYHGNEYKIDPPYQDSTYQSDSMKGGLVSFSTYGDKVAVVSENGTLNLYHEKQPLEAYLKTFRFEPFTESQKRKYGIK